MGCACVCVCVRACVRVCVRACVRACVCVRVRVRVRVVVLQQPVKPQHLCITFIASVCGLKLLVYAALAKNAQKSY
jgi:hypothetical protein